MFNIFKVNQKNSNLDKDSLVSLNKIGKLVKEKRELFGMTRSELSIKTKISVAVIEAIEKGWKKNLPEDAYLSTMLVALENHLNLGKNSLNVYISNSNTRGKASTRNLVTPGNIYFFSSWQGTFLYFILILSSILLLNRQQKLLSNKYTRTISPLLPEELKIKPTIPNTLEIKRD